MFDATAILLQAEMGSTPASWHVLRGMRTLAAVRGLQATSLTLALLLLVNLVGKATGWLIWSMPLWGVIVGVALGVGVLVGGLVAGQRKYSLLVLTPDGFVQRTSKSARTIFAVSYRDLEHMQIEVNAQQRNGYTCAPVVGTRDAKIDLKIRLSYRSKNEVIWQPDKRFGSSLAILPFLNESYVQHFAFHALKRPSGGRKIHVWPEVVQEECD